MAKPQPPPRSAGWDHLRDDDATGWNRQVEKPVAKSPHIRAGKCRVLTIVAVLLLAAAAALAGVFVVKARQNADSSAAQALLNGGGSSTGTSATGNRPVTVQAKLPAASSVVQTVASATVAGTRTNAVVPPAAAPSPISAVGRCGAQFGDALCPTVANEVTKGYTPCCGSDGHCGHSLFSCGDGCQSGCTAFAPAANLAGSGNWAMAGRSGVPAMHMILIPGTSNVVFLDKISRGTELRLADGRWAISSEFNPATLGLLPLRVSTNSFCSGVAVMANGTIISVGGNDQWRDRDPRIGTGYNAIRLLTRPCDTAVRGDCDWKEYPGLKLQAPRWYPTVVALPDERMFVIGGIGQYDQGYEVNKVTNQPTYEFFPATSRGLFRLPLLEAPEVFPFQLYPHVHVLRSGRLFIMAAMSSVILDLTTNQVVKMLPVLQGIFPRTYPAAGSVTFLPLSPVDDYASHIMVCGGGHPSLGTDEDATDTCGIITPEAENPTWDDSEKLPTPRFMGDPTILADGSVLFINGAGQGSGGFDTEEFGVAAKAPTLAPDLFIPNAPKGRRWVTLKASTIARMYHSVSQLMPNATVLVSGSNPHLDPDYRARFPTEMRNEIFTPPYLLTGNARPSITAASVPVTATYGQTFRLTAQFDAAKPLQAALFHPGGVTHSLHMSTRYIWVPTVATTATAITVTIPPDANVAPPGPYLLYLVNDGVPSVGRWITISR